MSDTNVPQSSEDNILKWKWPIRLAFAAVCASMPYAVDSIFSDDKKHVEHLTKNGPEICKKSLIQEAKKSLLNESNLLIDLSSNTMHFKKASIPLPTQQDIKKCAENKITAYHKASKELKQSLLLKALISGGFGFIVGYAMTRRPSLPKQQP